MLSRMVFFYTSAFSPSASRLGIRTLCIDSRRNRLLLYEDEWKQQADAKSLKIDKAIVTIINHRNEEKQLLMNDQSSTFYDCLKHISRHVAERTALIAVESKSGVEFVPVHAAINGNTKIHCLNFNNCSYADEVNKAYWRSCAFLLGAIVETSFRSKVYLKAALPPHYEEGRFGYVAAVKGLKNWNPTESELRVLTRAGLRNYVEAGLPFQPLTVDRKLAAEIFNDNPMKRDLILKDDVENVTLYKMGDHIDITSGPLIANTKQIGRFAVTKVEEVSGLYSFYGVSVPAAQACTSFSWDLILASSKLSSGSGEMISNCVK